HAETSVGVLLGAGTDDNQVNFTSLGLILAPQATVPTNPINGCMAMSDGTAGGFDAVSGAGLYRYDGSAWVFIG
ncbi:MAG: hypothetical protein AAGA22_09880, partial [Pseudomonadota bacterium]